MPPRLKWEQVFWVILKRIRFFFWNLIYGKQMIFETELQLTIIFRMFHQLIKKICRLINNINNHLQIWNIRSIKYQTILNKVHPSFQVQGVAFKYLLSVQSSNRYLVSCDNNQRKSENLHIYEAESRIFQNSCRLFFYLLTSHGNSMIKKDDKCTLVIVVLTKIKKQIKMTTGCDSI